MRKTIVGGIITPLIVLILFSIMVAVWEKTTDGSLIKLLGGATIENLQCKAYPVEETAQFRRNFKPAFLHPTR